MTCWVLNYEQTVHADQDSFRAQLKQSQNQGKVLLHREFPNPHWIDIWEKAVVGWRSLCTIQESTAGKREFDSAWAAWSKKNQRVCWKDLSISLIISWEKHPCKSNCKFDPSFWFLIIIGGWGTNHILHLWRAHGSTAAPHFWATTCSIGRHVFCHAC